MVIHQKFDNEGYQSFFTNSVIRDYERKQNTRQQQECAYILAPNFFANVKESILVEFPYYLQNHLAAKQFLLKFHQFTSQKFQVTIKWIAKKAKSFFFLKDKNRYPACQTYKGTSVCNEAYIDETIRNVDI